MVVVYHVMSIVLLQLVNHQAVQTPITMMSTMHLWWYEPASVTGVISHDSGFGRRC